MTEIEATIAIVASIMILMFGSYLYALMQRPPVTVHYSGAEPKRLQNSIVYQLTAKSYTQSGGLFLYQTGTEIVAPDGYAVIVTGKGNGIANNTGQITVLYSANAAPFQLNEVIAEVVVLPAVQVKYKYKSVL